MSTSPRERPFAQVNVFSAEPYLGNPVAVVLDGEGLRDEEMAEFARWTNLSETTFVLAPTSPEADYRLRIWTPGGELPFAGHPTLGSAHAWLDAGNTAREPGRVVQECVTGLVPVRIHDDAPAFAAPPTVRSGALSGELLTRLARALGVDRDRIVAHQWVDNGPGWAAVLLPSADEVLALEPDLTVLEDIKLGVVGPYPPGHEHAVEVRAFMPSLGVEDPVTGSLNASLGQWLIRTGELPARYTASQGTRLGRRGVIRVASSGEDVFVGGECTVCIRGTVML